MDSSSRSLRAALLAVGVANIAFAAMFLFQPETVSSLYDGVLLDTMHLYLGSGLGALLIVLGIGAFLAFAHPVRHAGIVILIILAQFFLFLNDVIVLARAQMRIMTLLPEMVYFLITAVLLIRYFPVQKKEKKSEKKEETESQNSDPILEEPLLDDTPQVEKD